MTIKEFSINSVENLHAQNSDECTNVGIRPYRQWHSLSNAKDGKEFQCGQVGVCITKGHSCADGDYNQRPITGKNGSRHTPGDLKLNISVPAEGKISISNVKIEFDYKSIGTHTYKKSNGSCTCEEKSSYGPDFQGIGIQIAGKKETSNSFNTATNSWKKFTYSHNGFTAFEKNINSLFSVILDFNKNLNTNPGIIYIKNLKTTVTYTLVTPPCSQSLGSISPTNIYTSVKDNCATEFSIQTKRSGTQCNFPTSVTAPTRTSGGTTTDTIKTFYFKDKTGIAGIKAYKFNTTNSSVLTANINTILYPYPTITHNLPKIFNIGLNKADYSFKVNNLSCRNLKADIYMDGKLVQSITDDDCLNIIWETILNSTCGDHTISVRIGTGEIGNYKFTMASRDIGNINITPIGNEEGVTSSNAPCGVFYQSKNGKIRIDQTKYYSNNTMPISIIINGEKRVFENSSSIVLDIDTGKLGTQNISVKQIDDCGVEKVYTCIIQVIPDHFMYKDALLVRAEDGTSFDYKSLAIWEDDGTVEPISTGEIISGVSIDDIKIVAKCSPTRMGDEGFVEFQVLNNSPDKITNLKIEPFIVKGIFKDIDTKRCSNDIEQANFEFKNTFKLEEFYNVNPQLQGRYSLDYTKYEDILLTIDEIGSHQVSELIRLPFLSWSKKTIYMRFNIIGEVHNYIDQDSQYEYCSLPIDILDVIDNHLEITCPEGKANCFDLNISNECNNIDSIYKDGCFRTTLNYKIYNTDSYKISEDEYKSLLINNSSHIKPVVYKNNEEVDILEPGEKYYISDASYVLREVRDDFYPLSNKIVKVDVRGYDDTWDTYSGITDKDGIVSISIPIPRDLFGINSIISFKDLKWNGESGTDNTGFIRPYFKGSSIYSAIEWKDDNGYGFYNTQNEKNNTKLSFIKIYDEDPIKMGDPLVLKLKLEGETDIDQTHIFFNEKFSNEGIADIDVEYKICEEGLYPTIFKTNDLTLKNNNVKEIIYAGVDTELDIAGRLKEDIIEKNEFNTLSLNVKNKSKKSKDTSVRIELDDKYVYSGFKASIGDCIFINRKENNPDQKNEVVWYIGDLDKDQKADITIDIKAIELGQSLLSWRAYNYLHSYNKDKDCSFDHKDNIDSIVINQRKKMDFNITQSADFVYPAVPYEYKVYIKNIASEHIDNIKMKVSHHSNINIDSKIQDFITVKDKLLLGEPFIFTFDVDGIMQPGTYYVTFLCWGDNTAVYTQTLKIICGYEKPQENTEHSITIYNFSPYERAYQLLTEEHNEETNKLIKIQKRPVDYPKLKMIPNFNKRKIKYNEDQWPHGHPGKNDGYEMPHIYIPKENYTINNKESFTGRNIRELVRVINDESKLLNIDLFKIGNNELDNNLYQIYPNGLIYRLGLMRSEIYHMYGIIPTFRDMSDKCMRWDVDTWDTKAWCGYHWDEESDEWVQSLYDSGVFQIVIPYHKVPKNYILPQLSDIESVIEKTKPFGMKALIYFQYEFDIDLNMDIDLETKFKPIIPIDLGEIDINRHIASKRMIDGKMVHYGKASYDTIEIDNYIDIKLDKPKPHGHLGLDFNIADNIESDDDKDYSTPKMVTKHNRKELFGYNKIKNYKDILLYNLSHDLAFYQYALDNVNIPISAMNNDLKIIIPKNKEPDSNFDKYEKVSFNINSNFDSCILNKYNMDNSDYGFYIMSGADKYLFYWDTNDLESNIIKISKINNNKTEILDEIIVPSNQIMIQTFIYNDKNIFIMYYLNNNEYQYINHIVLNNYNKIGVFLNNKKLRNFSENQELNISNNLFLSNRENEEIILNVTPHLRKENLIPRKYGQFGESWNNIYRMDNNENSYSYIKNNLNKDISCPQIYVPFESMNIKDSSLIDDIILRIKAQSNKTLNVQSKLLVNNLLQPKSIEVYNDIGREEIRYKLSIAERLVNKTDIIKYTKALSLSDNRLKSLPLDIKNPYWTQIYTDKINTNDTSIYIEGYSYKKSKVSIQMTGKEPDKNLISVNLDQGYFFKEINISSNRNDINGYRMKFNGDVKLIDSRVKVIQSNDPVKQEQYNYKNTLQDGISLITLKREDIKKAIDLSSPILYLKFDDLRKGEFINIYSLDVIIKYKEQESLLVTESLESKAIKDLNAIKGINSGFNSGSLFNEEPYIQEQSGEDVLDLTDSIYQSFTVGSKELTSTKLYFSGYYGKPDRNLELSILEDSGGIPGQTIETFNILMPDFENIKINDFTLFDTYITNLNPENSYWMKIKPLNKDKNNYYRLYYTNKYSATGNLLYEDNGDLKNMNTEKACLNFGINNIGSVNHIFKMPFLKCDLADGNMKFKLHLYDDSTVSNIKFLNFENKCM